MFKVLEPQIQVIKRIEMPDTFTTDERRSIKMALARIAYEQNIVRIADVNLSKHKWLVASPRGVFAVTEDQVNKVMHGWFFGICRHENQYYLFENCGLRNRSVELGRIVRVDLIDGKLSNPAVLVTGLHGNCHQIRVIDGLLCLVDTANQAIRRYTLDGEAVDVKFPYPVALATSRTGKYLHLNGIAKIGTRIAIMRHNGTIVPEKPSELGWLDANWNPVSLESLDGRWCHDIVEDPDGMLWHCGSLAGELINANGDKIKVVDDAMTRGLAITKEQIIVGISSFGTRQERASLPGGVVIYDHQFNRIATIELDGPPTDIALI